MTLEDRVQMERALRTLGITAAEIQQILQQPDREVCKVRLAELKEKVKKNFKVLALQLHPDVNGGDAAKTEMFKLVSRIRDDIEKLEITEPQPRPQIQVQIHFQVQQVPGFGRPPPGHPAANGRLRNWSPQARNPAVVVQGMHPTGVNPRRGS